jgi:small-conductance mechanosensitive channel
MSSETPLGELAQAIAEGLARPRHAWEALAIALAVIGAAILARVVARGLVRSYRGREGAAPTSSDAEARVRRVLFPLVGLVLLWLAELVLRLAHVLASAADARLLRLAAWLLGTLALVRVLFAGLRRALQNTAMITGLERAIGLLAILSVALYATGALSDVVEWLSTTQIPLGHAARVSLWSILVGSATTLGALLAAMWLGALIDARLAVQTTLEPNLRTALGRALRALLLVVAVLMALAVSGIDLTILSVFGGALGVGLGLGLQRIASNYVSGFILLLDRSLRIGDMVAVDKYYGKVTKINTRGTVLLQSDGTEAVIPNEMLVSLPVVNSTLSNRKLALTVPIMVGAHADLALVRELLCDAARSQPRVLADPAPAAALTEFRAGNLVLELSFWIADPENGRQIVQSGVAIAALERLRAHQIELAAPLGDFLVQQGTRGVVPGTPSMS